MRGPVPIAQSVPGYEECTAPPPQFNKSVIPGPAEEQSIRRANASEAFLLSLFRKNLQIDIASLQRAAKSTNPELKEKAATLMSEVLSLRVIVEAFKADLDAYTLDELQEQHEQTRLQCREAKAAFEEAEPELNRAKQYAPNADGQVQTLQHALNLIKDNPPRESEFPSKEEISSHQELVNQAKEKLGSAKATFTKWDGEVKALTNKRFHLAQHYNDLASEYKTQRKHVAALKGEPLTVGKESSFKSSNEFGL